MEKMTIEPDAIAPDATICSESTDPVAETQRALRILSGKWKAEILWRLGQRTHRFGDLLRTIPGVTQHMLTTRLRELEADGLVKRTVYAEVPPRVEYELTAAAGALRPVFEELFRWAREHPVQN